MKKYYVTPQICVSELQFATHLLNASDPSKTISANADGEKITVSDKDRSDITDIDYAKDHNAWSSWDE